MSEASPWPHNVPVSEYGNQKCACFIEIERLNAELARVNGAFACMEEAKDEYFELSEILKAKCERLAEALGALGARPVDSAFPSGYCFCALASQARGGHTGECQDATQALAAYEKGREG